MFKALTDVDEDLPAIQGEKVVVTMGEGAAQRHLLAGDLLGRIPLHRPETAEQATGYLIRAPNGTVMIATPPSFLGLDIPAGYEPGDEIGHLPAIAPGGASATHEPPAGPGRDLEESDTCDFRGCHERFTVAYMTLKNTAEQYCDEHGASEEEKLQVRNFNMAIGAAPSGSAAELDARRGLLAIRQKQEDERKADRSIFGATISALKKRIAKLEAKLAVSPRYLC